MTNEFFIAKEDSEGVVTSAASFTIIPADKVLIRFHDGKERVLKKKDARLEWIQMIELGWNTTENVTYEECVRAHLGRHRAPKPTRFALGKKNAATDEIISVTDFILRPDGEFSIIKGDGRSSRVARSQARLYWRELITDGWVEIPFRVAIGVRNRILSRLQQEASDRSFALNRMGDVRSRAANSDSQQKRHQEHSADNPEELRPFRHLDDNWDFEAIK